MHTGTGGVMDINKTSSMDLAMMYVYIKSYEEAISDFETAVKDTGFADLAIEAVREKFRERIERVSKELDMLSSGS
jgi:hypothetical protein